MYMKPLREMRANFAVTLKVIKSKLEKTVALRVIFSNIQTSA